MLKLRYDLSIWESAMFGGGDDDPALNFDGTSIFGELTHPVTFTGDFEIHVVFQLASGASGDLALAANDDADTEYIRLDATDGGMDIRYNNTYYGGAPGQFTPDTNEHTVIYKLDGTSLTKHYDGQQVGNHTVTVAPFRVGLVGKRSGGTTNYFGGQIKLIKFIDKSGASDVIQTYQINSGPPVYEMGAEVIPSTTFSDWTDSSVPDGWTKEGTHDANNYLAEAVGGGMRLVSDGTYIGVRYPVTEGQAYVYAVTTGDITGADDLYLQNGGGATIQRLADSNTTYTGVYIAETDRLLIKRTAGATDSVVESITVKPYISTISDGTLYQMIAGGSLGSELVTNGGFDTDSDWTKGTGWSIGSGVASCDGTQGGSTALINTGVALNTGDYYLTRFDVPTITAGSVRFGGSSTVRLNSGAYSEVITNYTSIRAVGDINFTGSVDNTTVKALPESIILYNVESTDWS
ncbi:MAG: hypothetical protein GY941_15750 [Planctomycetes bacterium]|nr:hypothetical protein [Planctomycetota bacterium]